MKSEFAPYYAVIFTSTLKEGDLTAYREMAQRMEELAKQQEGFLGIESARDDLGITVSYWRDEQSIQQWKHNMEHAEAQALGKSKWYKRYTVRVAKVEREYSK